MSRQFIDILDIPFTMPKGLKRIRLSHHPEIALVSLIVMAVKQYFPFEKEHAPPPDRGLPRVNWVKWNKIMATVVARTTYNKQDYDNVTTEQVASMTTAEREQWAIHVEKSLNIDKKSKIRFPASYNAHCFVRLLILQQIRIKFSSYSHTKTHKSFQTLGQRSQKTT